MKRGAEKQLTKDDDGDVEENDSDSGQGFKKASDTAIAARVIKPLPTRGGGKPSALTPQATLPANPFGLPPATSTNSAPIFPPSTSAFSGFSTTKSSTSGGFMSTSTTSSTAASSPFGLSSGSSSAFPSSTFSITPSASSAPPAVTNTSKAFASLLSTSSTSIFGPPPSTSSPGQASSVSKSTNGTDDSELIKYYTNLRALNASLLTSISNTVEKDPFSDMTSLLESYKAMRLKVQKEHEDSETKGGPPKPKSPDSKKGQAAGMPQPPTSFFGFSSMGSSSSTAGSDSKPPPTSAFGSLTSSNAAPASTKDSSPSPSKTSAPTTNLFSKPASSTSIFGSASPSSSSPFSFGSSTAITAPVSDKPSGFSFGATNSQPSSVSSNPFGSSAPVPTAEKSSSFFFGNASTQPPASTPNPFGTPSTNIFGSSTPSTSLPFSFGASGASGKKPEPSIGFGMPSPVVKSEGLHYSFGSTSGTSTPAATPAVATEGSSQETTNEEEGTDQATSGAESKEATPNPMGSNPHDEEGPGEENEETLHAVRLKAYRMKKADEKGGPGWAELGSGTFRIKKHKETDARRVLLRNSTNGKVNMNFKIYASLKPSIAKKALTFIGHDAGVSQTYCVRFADEAQAIDLKVALEREIEFVKAKEAS